jgi:electron-transferring-flavoprotein dehydrogenase
MSGTIHDEDQPCHLHIRDRDKCVECIETYDAPCQRFCPAAHIQRKRGRRSS